jgi:hypothetical protein
MRIAIAPPPAAATTSAAKVTVMAAVGAEFAIEMTMLWSNPIAFGARPCWCGSAAGITGALPPS